MTTNTTTTGHVENITTGMVHTGTLRKLRANFTDSGFVEWWTPDCEKGGAYRGRMQVTPTDAPVTCRRCLALQAPAKEPEGFHLEVTDGHGYKERFGSPRSATTWAVQHVAFHEALGYKLNADSVAAVKAAVGISDEEFDKKVAAKVRRIKKEAGL